MRRALLPALATAALTVASFPPFDLGPLACAALVPLLLAVGRAPGRDFLAGWLAGWLASTGIAWWVVFAMANYGGISWPVALPLMLLMTAAMGLFWGGFSWSLGVVHRRLPGAEALAAPVLWTLFEYLRAVLPDLAFPWALMGHALHRALPLIQVADLCGVWGVSFLVVLVNAALAALIRPGARGVRARLLPPAAAAAAVALAWGYGALRLDAPEEGARARVAVVQGNIRQDIKWHPDFKDETYRIHEALTREAAAAGADLVVWPESSIAMFYQAEPHYQRRLAALVRETGTPLLFGSPAAVSTAAGRSLRNRAWLLGADGEVAGWQDKLHLVPFGEYVPWKRALFFARKLVQEVGDFTPGERAKVLEVPAARFGALVCFEVIFPDVARRFVAAGAGLLVNITNDAWYERTAASKQHFVNLVFRAVENRRPVARAANTGISGFVDAKGRVLLESGLFVRGQYRAELALPAVETLSTRYGDWFPRLCALLAAALLLAALAVRRRPPGR